MKESPTKTVCLFNSNKAWGGGEKWHYTAAKELSRRGYRTILCANRGSELAKKANKDKIDVWEWEVSNLTFINPVKLFVLALFLKTKKVDSIILNLPSDLKYAGLAAKLAGVRKIIYRRGMPHPLRNTWLNRFLFQKVLTDVIVNSKEIGRTLKQGNEDWFPEDKVTLIYNGIDTSKDFDRTKKLYERQGDEFIIGNAGRLTEQKGQKYLIEMAEILVKDKVNFKILIAGEGELKQSLQKIINEKKLQERIQLIGHVEDMATFMNSIDVFVFPSLFEGSANTLLEAQYFGKPIVAWETSSNGEIIQNNINGFLVPTQDSKLFTQKVSELLYSKDLSDKLKMNGEKLVKEFFDSKITWAKLEQLIGI